MDDTLQIACVSAGGHSSAMDDDMLQIACVSAEGHSSAMDDPADASDKRSRSRA